ncbi:iron transporter [Kushneria phosphatilytica]|nr:iron transporter [Kushneria phosphatilytica]
MPYLQVDYTLRKQGSDQSISGTMDAMVANDGPHYGDNVRLAGPGKYHLTLTVHHPQMMRHIDKETGVGPWYKPFTVDYDFVYAGVGKKGGY